MSIQQYNSNKIAVRNLVESAWHDYVLQKWSFLNSVTFHYREDKDSVMGTPFRLVVPSYNRKIVSADNPIDTNSITSYTAPYLSMVWGQSDKFGCAFDLPQILSFTLTEEEYRMNFINGTCTALLGALFARFAATLDSTNGWVPLLMQFPNTTIPSAVNATFSELKRKWRDAVFYVSPDLYADIPLAFIPAVDDCAPWMLEAISVYGLCQGYNEMFMATHPRVLNGLIAQNTMGGNSAALLTNANKQQEYYQNGILKTYPCQNLQSIVTTQGWTQGLVWVITDVVENTNTYTLVLTAAQNEVNITSTIYLSKYIPLVIGVQRYSPLLAPNLPSSTNYPLCVYITEDYSTDSYGIISIVVEVSKEQFKFSLAPILSNDTTVFPTVEGLDISELVNLYCSTPWRPRDFYQQMNLETWQILDSQEVQVYRNYIYPKEAAHICAVVQEKLGPGVEHETHTVKKVPFSVDITGVAKDGNNQLKISCITPMQVIPQLGSAFLCVDTPDYQANIP